MNTVLAALLMLMGYISYGMMAVFEFVEMIFTHIALFMFSNAKFLLAKNLTKEEIMAIEREVDALD